MAKPQELPVAEVMFPAWMRWFSRGAQGWFCWTESRAPPSTPTNRLPRPRSRTKLPA